MMAPRPVRRVPRATGQALALRRFPRQVLPMAPERERRRLSQGVARKSAPVAGFVRCAIGMQPEGGREDG